MFVEVVLVKSISDIPIQSLQALQRLSICTTDEYYDYILD